MLLCLSFFFFFKQKTAYEMRISDWSSDVCSSDLIGPVNLVAAQELSGLESEQARSRAESDELRQAIHRLRGSIGGLNREGRTRLLAAFAAVDGHFQRLFTALFDGGQAHLKRSEEHTSELQSLMRISYAVFCLKKKKTSENTN